MDLWAYHGAIGDRDPTFTSPSMTVHRVPRVGVMIAGRGSKASQFIISSHQQFIVTTTYFYPYGYRHYTQGCSVRGCLHGYNFSDVSVAWLNVAVVSEDRGLFARG